LKFTYQMRFSKTGRARFIAHLDTLSCLMRAVRRAGFELATTEGMRPKPILSLAMPLGVGVEGEDEICDFALTSRAPLSELARKLGAELPEGMELKSVGPILERSKSAARVESVSYRILLARACAGLAEALERFNDADGLVVLRQRPKGDKEVDVKRYVKRVEMLDGEEGTGISFDMEVTREGTARPEEVVRLLSEFAGEELAVRRMVRTAIGLREEEAKRPPRPGQVRRPRRPARPAPGRGRRR